MCLVAHKSHTLVAVHGSAEMETQHAAHLLIEFTSGVCAIKDSLLIHIGKEIGTVGIGFAHGQAVGPSAEFKVETVFNSLVGVVCATPVAHHYPIISPLAFENIVEEDFVVAVVLILIEIVSAHQSPSSALFNGGFKCREVDFAQSAVAHDNIHLVAVFLIVV